MPYVPIQYQRGANRLEGILTALQIPNNIIAGGIDSALHGANPIAGAQAFVKEHKTFQDTLSNLGVAGAGATVGGLALDIATDPLNYLGVGELTKAGHLAKEATNVFEHAMLVDDVAKQASALVRIGDTGVLLPSRAEQVMSGQRNLIQFGGKSIVPKEVGAKVYSALDNTLARVGDTSVGRAFNTAFRTASQFVPPALRLRDVGRKAAIIQRRLALGDELGKHGSEFYQAVKDLGLDPETAQSILRDTAELSGTSHETVDLTQFMTRNERKKYIRAWWDAEAYKRGIEPQLYRDQQQGDALKRQFIAGRARRPPVGVRENDPLMTESADALTAMDSPANLAAVRKSGRAPKFRTPAEAAALGQLPGGIGNVAPEVNARGNEMRRLAQPNLFGLSDSWDGLGTMPPDLAGQFLTQGFENSHRMVRRIEQRAIAEFHASKLSDALKLVKEKYGHEFVSGLDEPVKKAVNYINVTNAAFLANERASGLRIHELTGNLNYLKHAITPQARDAYIEASGMARNSNSYEVSVRYASQLMRDENLRDKTISEINALAEQGLLPGLTGRKKIQIFENDPFHATFIRGTESAKAVEAANLMRDAARVYGKVIGDGVKPLTSADTPIGYRTLSTRLAEDLGWGDRAKDGTMIPWRIKANDGTVLKDIALPHDIANLLESQYEKVITPKLFQPILHGFDTITRMWKLTALPIWPAYHTRNFMSDLMLITHGANEYGLHMHEAVSSFTDAAKGLFGGAETLSLGKHGEMQWSELRDMMNKFGILDYSPARDLDEHIARPFGLPRFDRGIDRAASRLEAVGIGNLRPVEAGLRAGQARQNLTNAGYFIGLLKKGIAPEQAALEVKARLFDFGDLTDFERQVLRRVFPFYSWLRHNLPYQIQAAIQKPRTISLIPKVRELASGGEGPAGDTPLPRFLRDALPMRLGGDPDHPVFARLTGLIPQGDLGLFNDPLDATVANMSPFIKVPIEVASNYDPWQQQNLERYPWEMGRRWGLSFPKRLTPVVDAIRPLSELNSALGPGSAVSKIESKLYARGYQVDKDLQFRLMAMKIKEQELAAKHLMQLAARKGDTGGVVRIRQWMQSIYNQPTRALK